MFVKDLRREFYDTLIGKRILLLVHTDIDGICSSKILQHLFRTDHILYTQVAVQTTEHLKQAFIDHCDQIKTVILLNCGGCIDIVDFLQPADDIQFFIADNHRPIDICNVYNDYQVKVICNLEEESGIPAFDDVFRDDESEEEDDEDSPRFDEELLEKRRLKRIWTQRRQKLLFDYSQFAYYQNASAAFFFDLAWKLSKDSNELLWWAIVGETELYISEKVNEDKYLLVLSSLQNHVSRLNHQTQDEKPLDSVKITFNKELYLVLYRHWTLVQSMNHSPHFASSMKLWTLKGEKRMRELLAEIGLPLVECGQNYINMDIKLRNEVQELLESKIEKYGLANFVYPSFHLSHGFKHKYSASDYVYAMTSLLESTERDKVEMDCFVDAMDSLNIFNVNILHRGIQSSKIHFEVIYRQVTTFLNLNQVISAGPFLYATVIQGSPDAPWFSSPHCLLLLSQFTLRAHVSVSRNKKSRSLPLIISVPDVKHSMMTQENSEDSFETCLICGIPPLSEETRNLFGKAFEQAAENTSSKAQLHFFDTNIIRLAVKDRSTFFDALISLLS